MEIRKSIIRPIENALTSGDLCIRNGKITPGRPSPPITSFIHTGGSGDWQYCAWQLGVWFPLYNIIPIGCMDCYKVVVRPRSLDELLSLHKLQKELGYPSKCGIEGRESVRGNWGGYFYNHGLPDGLKCYKDIRSRIKEEIPIILKRGCTEYEMRFGPSDKWVSNIGQVDLEKDLFDACDMGFGRSPQPGFLINDIMNNWLRWAEKYGVYMKDESYLKYTDGKRFFPEVVTYHDKKKIVTFKNSEELQTK